MGILTDWPPSDAPSWVKRWRQMGCPPIEVEAGTTVVDLEKWFLPTDFPPPERQVARMVAELRPRKRRPKKEQDAEPPAVPGLREGPEVPPEEVTVGQTRLW